MDNNGYLHFATVQAGDIIISSGPLTSWGQTVVTSAEGVQGANTWPVTNPQQDTIVDPSGTADATASTESTNRYIANTGRTLINTGHEGSLSVPKIVLFTSLALLAVLVLWAVVPRKGDTLISIEDYRKSQG